MVPARSGKPPVIPGYEVQEFLGSGSMGSVYKARHRETGLTVAVKVVAKRHARDEDFIEHFYREARLAARFDHPAILRIYHLSDHRSHPFFAMEYAPASLRSLLVRRGSAPLSEVMRLCDSLLSALQALAGDRVVHRDLKPENILLSPEWQYKLADFGIATCPDLPPPPGNRAGTPAYMAPEAIKNPKRADSRADLYSFGVILYECLTGSNPFHAQSVEEIIQRQMRHVPPAVTGLNSHIPESLGAVVSRLLEKSPRKRYQLAHEVLVEIRKISASVPMPRETWAAADRRAPAPDLSPCLAEIDRALDTGDWECASALITEAKRACPRNADLRSRERSLDAHRRRQGLINDALGLLRGGDATGAAQLARAALADAPGDSEFETILEEANAAHAVASLLREVDTLLANGDIQEASQRIASTDPEIAASPEIEQRKRTVEKALIVLETLNDAVELARGGRLEEAKAYISGAGTLHDVRVVREHVRKARAELERQAERWHNARRLVSEARADVEKGRPDVALERLTEVRELGALPPDLTEVEVAAKRAFELRDRADAISALLDEHQYRQALSAATAALDAFPGEEALVRLKAEAGQWVCLEELADDPARAILTGKADEALHFLETNRGTRCSDWVAAVGEKLRGLKARLERGMALLETAQDAAAGLPRRLQVVEEASDILSPFPDLHVQAVDLAKEVRTADLRERFGSAIEVSELSRILEEAQQRLRAGEVIPDLAQDIRHWQARIHAGKCIDGLRQAGTVQELREALKRAKEVQVGAQPTHLKSSMVEAAHRYADMVREQRRSAAVTRSVAEEPEESILRTTAEEPEQVPAEPEPPHRAAWLRWVLLAGAVGAAGVGLMIVLGGGRSFTVTTRPTTLMLSSETRDLGRSPYRFSRVRSDTLTVWIACGDGRRRSFRVSTTRDTTIDLRPMNLTVRTTPPGASWWIVGGAQRFRAGQTNSLWGKPGERASIEIQREGYEPRVLSVLWMAAADTTIEAALSPLGTQKVEDVAAPSPERTVPRPSPVREPQPPAPPQSRTVRIRTNPEGVRLLVNGVGRPLDLGVTQLDEEVGKSIALRFETVSGHVIHEDSERVPAGGGLWTLNRVLPELHLSCRGVAAGAVYDAHLSLDGQDVEMGKLLVGPGRHQIRADHLTYGEADTTVAVGYGEQKRVSLTLRRYGE